MDVGTADLAKSKTIEGWFPMVNKHGKELRGGGKLRLKLWFEGSNEEVFTRGINTDTTSLAVQYTTFPERQGNIVTLYQVPSRTDPGWSMVWIPCLSCTLARTADGADKTTTGSWQAALLAPCCSCK